MPEPTFSDEMYQLLSDPAFKLGNFLSVYEHLTIAQKLATLLTILHRLPKEFFLQPEAKSILDPIIVQVADLQLGVYGAAAKVLMYGPFPSATYPQLLADKTLPGWIHDTIRLVS